jgi:hypothetical protein
MRGVSMDTAVKKVKMLWPVLGAIITLCAAWLTYQNFLPSISVTVEFAKPIVRGELVLIHGSIKNTGASTANRAQMTHFGFGIWPADQTPQVDLNAEIGITPGPRGVLKEIPKGVVSDLGPGQQRDFTNNSGYILGGEAYDAVVSGMSRFYVWGKVKYLDSLHVPRERCFCRMSEFAPAFRSQIFGYCDSLICK